MSLPVVICWIGIFRFIPGFKSLVSMTSIYMGAKLIIICLITTTFASDDEDRLLADKFRNYNSLIRPVEGLNATPIVVNFGLAMILLINVDEKNQIMQTNVWLTMRWRDYQLTWEPELYGHIKTIRIPPDKVWLPDIVLFNNADGNYEVSFYSNVVVEHTGRMLWVPPAIYKSSCTINVEYFPFDQQMCTMTFGSWTYNQNEVQLNYLDGKDQVELNDYSHSGIWDIMDVPGQLSKGNSEIKFHIHIRRKTLFYTVILIIPTVLMAFLSMMVFYLPADASEKITLAISILLALVVFLLLVSKILPPTSSTIPLMAKYLLLTFVMNVVTILVTVVIINVYFRGPSTHRMPQWARSLFLNLLPRLLLMRRPCHLREYRKRRSRLRRRFSNGTDPSQVSIVSLYRSLASPSPSRRPSQQRNSFSHHPHCTHMPDRLNAHSECQNWTTMQQQSPRISSNSSFVDENNCEIHNWRKYGAKEQIFENILPPEANNAIEALEYITGHLKKDEEFKMVRDEWKYISTVLDRLLLYTFFGVTVGGTLGILLSAPNVFDYVDQKAIIKSLQDRANSKYRMTE